MSADRAYSGREQTQVKHFILRNYLERFAHIIGYHWAAINYVDAFSGPWNAQAGDFSDSSFAIAIDELRNALDHLRDHGRAPKIRAFFCERSPQAFAKLEEFRLQLTDVEVELSNDEFEAALDGIRLFCDRGGQSAFTFVFIDPTGWTGFGIRKIAPLLKRANTEVLINFMTGHILRFFSAHVARDSFREFYGDDDLDDLLAAAAQLQGPERVDLLVRHYQANLKRLCSFRHCCSAVVLNPEKERPHYHLVYATRKAKGVEEFKKVEQKAMSEMERLRAAADIRRDQTPLLQEDDPPPSRYYLRLRERYLRRAKHDVEALLVTKPRIAYDELFHAALESPLVWENDLQTWIQDWRKQGALAVEGLRTAREKPKRDRNHFLVWHKPGN